MAVTKIHRTSRLTLITTIIVSLIVLGLFFFGGQAPEHEKIGADLAQPAFTDILLYWMYALLVITIVVLIAFSIVDFARGLKEVMRFSGPRMLFAHPIEAIRHFNRERKRKK
jgi:amino acid transporter